MIEKIGPTIYKGESIYKTGAGGGGGGGGGLFGGKPFQIYSTKGDVNGGVNIYNDLIEMKSELSTAAFNIIPIFQENIDNIDEVEVSVKGKFYKYQNRYIQTIGGNKNLNNYDFIRLQVYGGGDVIGFYFDGDYYNTAPFTNGGEYVFKVNAKNNNGNVSFLGYQNGTLIASVSKTITNKLVSFSFGGCDSLDYKLGNNSIIYSKGTYIKLNGSLVWGEEE